MNGWCSPSAAVRTGFNLHSWNQHKVIRISLLRVMLHEIFRKPLAGPLCRCFSMILGIKSIQSQYYGHGAATCTFWKCRSKNMKSYSETKFYSHENWFLAFKTKRSWGFWILDKNNVKVNVDIISDLNAPSSGGNLHVAAILLIDLFHHCRSNELQFSW